MTNSLSTPSTLYGPVTAPLVGLAMKEMVRRAIKVIRNQRFVFDARRKDHLDETMEDLVTTADHEAQEVYLRSIGKCFPDYGVIAEEDELRVPCRIPNRELHFMVDPLDGTKAFARRQSAGVGTMIALVDGRDVLAAYVGDIMTQEIYGYRPESSRVYRLSEFEVAERLITEPNPLRNSYVLLRQQPKELSEPVASIVDRFKGVDVEGGSIGISYARLWKQECDALLVGPHFTTPWDSAPIIGISKKLGYKCLKIDDQGGMQEIDLYPPQAPERNDFHMLVVKECLLPELLQI
jgi:fructose-1,6-bisphosphatase/inositol monophosphatase family enzyme